MTWESSWLLNIFKMSFTGELWNEITKHQIENEQRRMLSHIICTSLCLILQETEIESVNGLEKMNDRD